MFDEFKGVVESMVASKLQEVSLLEHLGPDGVRHKRTVRRTVTLIWLWVAVNNSFNCWKVATASRDQAKGEAVEMICVKGGATLL